MCLTQIKVSNILTTVLKVHSSVTVTEATQPFSLIVGARFVLISCYDQFFIPLEYISMECFKEISSLKIAFQFTRSLLFFVPTNYETATSGL